jgi:predicted RNA methylase
MKSPESPSASPFDVDAPVKPTAREIAAGYREFTGGNATAVALHDDDEVDTWHFPMMNDAVRNSAYEKALRGALKQGGVVLDIGSGSGLLAMMAARQGATSVVTCEEIGIIARTATDIIARNGYADKIKLINKLSTNLVVGKDLPERADVLVTEIFDDGLLGERAFHAIQHARDHLLKPDAQIIPAGARVMAMCIESREIYENHRIESAAGFDLSPFNMLSVRNYIGYHLKKFNYRPLSAPKPVFDFDFYNIPGDESVELSFDIIEPGLVHAIVYWYELQMDDDTIISTAPNLPKLSCWKQAVQVLDHPERLEHGDRLQIRAQHDAISIWFTPSTK